MMPNIHRLRGRIFIVLVSLMVVFLAPRHALADEAEISSSSPSASSAASSVVTAIRATDLPVIAAAGPYFSASPAAPGSKHSPAPTLCQISDTVYRADGTPAQGTVLLSWPSFTTAAGQAVTPGSLLVTLDASGGFNASLAPNTGASPAGTYYKAIFKLDDGTTETEFWVVPNSQTTTIGAIRSKLVPSNQAAQFLTRDFADSYYVGLASTQTISGVKTFSASPAVPTPVNPTDTANKAYVDANAGGNLASPPPIGNITPNAGAFTDLTSSIFPQPNVRAYGATGNGQRTGPNCAMTSGSPNLYCPTGTGSAAPFLVASPGDAISVENAGTGPNCTNLLGTHTGPCNLVTTILSVTDGNHLVLAANALNTSSTGYAVWGHNDTSFIRNAIAVMAASPTPENTRVYFPHVVGQNSGVTGYFTGCYIITDTIVLPEGNGGPGNRTLTLEGDGYLSSAICQLTVGKPVMSDTFVYGAGHAGWIIKGLGFVGLPDYFDIAGPAVSFTDVNFDTFGPDNWVTSFTTGLDIEAVVGVGEVTVRDSTFEELKTAIQAHGTSDAHHISLLRVTGNSFGPMLFAQYTLDYKYVDGLIQYGNWMGPDLIYGILCNYCSNGMMGPDDWSAAYVDGGGNGNNLLTVQNSSNMDIHDEQFNAATYYPVIFNGNNTNINFHDNTVSGPTSTYNAIFFGGTGNQLQIHHNRILQSVSSGAIYLDGAAIVAGTVISDNYCASSITTCVSRVGSPVPAGAYVALNSLDAAVNGLTAQTVSVAGDLTARDITGVEYFVSKYGSIQAAINAAYNNGAVLGTVIDDRTAPYSGPGFILYDSVTLTLAATTYTITSTVSYNNGNNNVTAGIIALPGAKLIGASTSTNHGTIITAGNGLNADLIATSTVGTGIGSAAQWWHWGGFENLRVMGNGAHQTAGNCFNIENMGEVAFLRTIEVSGCYLDNILFTGASATPSDIANITTNSAGRYGFNFNNLAGVAVVHGLSGDSNATSIIRLNGGQSGTLTILGFKTEEEVSGQDPLITIDETGESTAQPSLFIIGGYTFGRSGVHDIIKYVNGVAGTTPYISVSNFYTQDYVNAVNDVVNGRTTAAGNMNKVPFYYGPTGAFYSGQAFTLDLNTFVQSPHSGNNYLTEVFGTTSSNETLVAASGTSTDLSIGGIGFRMPNRSVYGQTPELFAKMTYAFPGGVPNTQQWEFIPAKVGGDNSTRWIGDPSYRWDEIYSADVNTTTATVGTLNVTTCNGCGSGAPSGTAGGDLSGSFPNPTVSKINGQTPAAVATSGSYNDLSNKPTLATVATSGSYNDLSNRPAIPAPQVNSDWNAASGVAQILNKPALATVATSGSYNDLSNKPSIPAQGAHLVSGTMQGQTAQITGTGSYATLYSATIPAGTATAGTGLKCRAYFRHTTGSATVTMQWKLGSTSQAYATTFTGGNSGGMADIEIFTPSSTNAEIVNIPYTYFGGTLNGPTTGLAWSENLTNANTIYLQFNVAATDKLTGDTFYCQTVQ